LSSSLRSLRPKCSPQNPSNIEAAINTCLNLIQWAGWTSLPEPSKVRQTPSCPLFIRQKLLEKRRLRQIWLQFRSPHIKCQLNKATRELKELLSDNYNASFQHYIQNLSPTASTDYSLWKAVKRIKHIPSSSPHFKQLKELGHVPISPKPIPSSTI
jgi:hypothetical protein